MKNLLFAIVASVISILTVSAQSAPDFSTVKTEKGMMVLSYDKVQAFSFLVPGSDPEGRQNDDGSLLVSTGSGVIVVYFVKTSGFLDKKKTYTEAETLIAHRDWDISTQEKAWGSKLIELEKAESFVKVFDLTNNLFPTKLLPTIKWNYIAPKPHNTDRTIYQTVLLGDTVLMLGAVFPSSIKTEEVRTFFTRSLESLTILPPQKPAVTAKPKLRPKNPNRRT